MTGASPHEAVVFDTALGVCALAWSIRGISAIQLPCSDTSETLRVLRRRVPGVAGSGGPPPTALRAIEGIRAVLDGAPESLSTVVLDLDGVPAFHQRVYAATRGVAPGSTVTYGDIAEKLAAPGAARAVGQALGRNPYPIVVPCHRVLAAGGKLGGFSAHGGLATKQRLLSIERAMPTLFDV